MDTNLSQNIGNVNSYAENITRQTLVLPAPFALPSIATCDGFPNYTISELDKISIKAPEWFSNQVGQVVFVASRDGENGQINIYNSEYTRALHHSQEYGYKYLTLVDRLKQAIGASYYSPEYQEPEAGRHYTYTAYINGEVKEQKPVQYLGLTDCLRWYIFRFTDGPDQEGNQHHLLPVGEFPAYRKQTAPGVFHFEKYTSLLTIVK